MKPTRKRGKGSELEEKLKKKKDKRRISKISIDNKMDTRETNP